MKQLLSRSLISKCWRDKFIGIYLHLKLNPCKVWGGVGTSSIYIISTRTKIIHISSRNSAREEIFPKLYPVKEECQKQKLFNFLNKLSMVTLISTLKESYTGILNQLTFFSRMGKLKLQILVLPWNLLILRNILLIMLDLPSTCHLKP